MVEIHTEAVLQLSCTAVGVSSMYCGIQEGQESELVYIDIQCQIEQLESEDTGFEHTERHLWSLLVEVVVEEDVLLFSQVDIAKKTSWA